MTGIPRSEVLGEIRLVVFPEQRQIRGESRDREISKLKKLKSSCKVIQIVFKIF